MESQKEFIDYSQPRPGATYALVILTAINLFNYVDRYVPSATKDLFKEGLKLTDTETSLPLTAFMLIYMVASPVFGILSDRGVSRKLLIIIGIVLWSVATAAAFFAVDFWTFLLCRMGVGVGEAAYATISPSLLSDFYPPQKRNRALTIFQVAMPVGGALGYTFGGILGTEFGWRYAFLICGAPGVLLALLILKIREPGRGVFDRAATQKMPWKEAMKSLAYNKVYIVAVAGNIFLTFGAGGMADWITTYLYREDNFDYADSGTMVGAVTVIGGIGGTLLGGFLGDKLRHKIRHPYLAVSCFALFPAVALTVAVLYLKNFWAISVLLCLAQLFLWCYSGPLTALIANAVPAQVRTRAFSLYIFLIHALGDAISPFIIGLISDKTGNLFEAMLMIPISAAIGGLIWFFGWRFLPEVHISDAHTSSRIASSFLDDHNSNEGDEDVNDKVPLLK